MDISTLPPTFINFNGACGIEHPENSVALFSLRPQPVLSDLSRCGWEALKAFYTNGVQESKAVPGAVVAIQTFGLRLGDLRLGEGFSSGISSPPAYPCFRRLPS